MLGEGTVIVRRCDILGPRPNKPQCAGEEQLCILLGQGTVILSRCDFLGLLDLLG